MLVERPAHSKSLRGLTLVTALTFLIGCGAVYTPQNLPRQGREAEKSQADIELTFIALDRAAVITANQAEYKRRVIDGSNLNGSARLQTESAALAPNWPATAPPQPYLIGAGDTLALTRIMGSDRGAALATQKIRVSETGHITLLDVGREQLQERLPSERGPLPYLIGVGDVLGYSSIITTIDGTGTPTRTVQSQSLLVSATGDVSILGVGDVSVSGLNLAEARNEVAQLLLRRGLAIDFQIGITGFNSQQYIVGGAYGAGGQAFTSEPVTLNALITMRGVTEAEIDRLNIYVRVIRGDREYIISAKRLLTGVEEYYIHSGDRILVEVSSLSPMLDPIPVAGLTADQARGLIEGEYRANQLTSRTSLEVTGFTSQKYFVSGDVARGGVYPLTNTPVLLAEALAVAGLRVDSDADAPRSFADHDKVIKLTRAGHGYRFSARELLANPAGLYVHSGDRLAVTDLRYRSEKVIIAGAVARQTIYPITAEDRQTLSDALYSAGALSTSSGDPSQIYVLRQAGEAYAYHLDGSNPARLFLASEFELRPNDIIFIAEQPIIQFNRVLQQVLQGIGGITALTDQIN